MDAPPEPARSEPPPGATPASWVRRVFFGRADALDPDTLRVLRLVSLGVFFENYDIGLLNAALPQIATELEISTGDTGLYLSAIRCGGLGTFLLVPFADWFGRRRVFLFALLGMSVGTLATGLSGNALQFAAFQMLTRVFMLTCTALALVIVVEELPAAHRGAGIGLMSVLGGLGYGLGAGLYAAVDVLPYGWRSLYALGVLPVALLPFFRRALRETRRFEEHRRGRTDGWPGAWRSWTLPVRELVTGSPQRAAAVGLAGLFSAMGSIVVFGYTSYFVQEAHGWAPGDYTLMVITAGLLGVWGNVLGGRGSDRFGRRRVGFVSFAVAPLAAALFYHGPGPVLPLAWGLFVLCLSAGELIVRAFATELFPTAHRSTSSGWLIVVQTVGWSLGLLLVGLGTESLDDLARMVTAVGAATLLAGLCLLALPETRRHELESLS